MFTILHSFINPGVNKCPFPPHLSLPCFICANLQFDPKLFATCLNLSTFGQIRYSTKFHLPEEVSPRTWWPAPIWQVILYRWDTVYHPENVLFLVFRWSTSSILWSLCKSENVVASHFDSSLFRYRIVGWNHFPSDYRRHFSMRSSFQCCYKTQCHSDFWSFVWDLTFPPANF